MFKRKKTEFQEEYDFKKERSKIFLCMDCVFHCFHIQIKLHIFQSPL